MTEREVVRFNKLAVTISVTPDNTTYTFEGDVDESFIHDKIKVPSAKKIVLQLEKIRNFNSCGIREWIYFVRRLNICPKIEFHNCSVTMIDQINMIPDSLGGGQIISFLAPYYCENHGESSQLVVMKEAEIELRNKVAPEFACGKCGSPLQFDALEESYFLFMDDEVSQAS